jgi:GH25 family lysozyme M1 (1,4-beta-N-acetylmuramidase)
MSKTIMDVSKHQGTIDWAKVKASGKIDGVMLRAMGNSADGLPSKPYTDPQFARNYAECTRLGIPCGVYGYFKATNKTQADKELAYFKKLLAGRSFELPVAVDIEDEVQKPLGKAALTDIAAHCLSTVESWGVYALLYTGLWFGQTYLYMGGAALKAYDVWLARYPKDQSKTKPEDKPKTAFTFGMWQYTSTAHIPGVVDATPGKVTNVDLSHAYKDYATIIQRARLGAVRR